MKKLFVYFLLFATCLLTACDVHEWPEPTTGARLNLHLVYQTNLPIWVHPYSERVAQTDNNSVVTQGIMQYVVRLFPVNEAGQTSLQYSNEYIFAKPVADGYNLSTSIDVPPGNYQIMVWSQLFLDQNAYPFYDYTSFMEVRLQSHAANTDYRDAFRGKENVSVEPTYVAKDPIDIEIAMQRPLAKFEFVTNDLNEFVLKEIKRNQVANRSERVLYEDIMRNLTDYTIRFYYVGYMPDAFSIYTDRPVDSSTGVLFESSMRQLNKTEASLGFDYVFTNGKESEISVQIAVLDAFGTQLSLTNPIAVPIKRSYHTIIKGNFLMGSALGGIEINPDYHGDHNVILRDEETQNQLDSNYVLDTEITL